MFADNLTQKDAYELFNTITGSDDKFVQAMARAAIESARDITTDMFVEFPIEDQADMSRKPKDFNDTIRNQASAFADDMIKDFSDALQKAIKELKFDANAKVVVALKTNLKFD